MNKVSGLNPTFSHQISYKNSYLLNTPTSKIYHLAALIPHIKFFGF